MWLTGQCLSLHSSANKPKKRARQRRFSSDSSTRIPSVSTKLTTASFDVYVAFFPLLYEIFQIFTSTTNDKIAEVCGVCNVMSSQEELSAKQI